MFKCDVVWKTAKGAGREKSIHTGEWLGENCRRWPVLLMWLLIEMGTEICVVAIRVCVCSGHSMCLPEIRSHQRMS